MFNLENKFLQMVEPAPSQQPTPPALVPALVPFCAPPSAGSRPFLTSIPRMPPANRKVWPIH
jgi:hypothetical protein